MRRILTALAFSAAVACTRDRSGSAIPEGSGPLVVLYKAEQGGARPPARGAKLAVWAAEPDRLHAEIVAPVGGVTHTLDAGGGRVCIVDVAQGIAYVGEDGTGALEALVGLSVSIADAVAALLHGVAPSGLTVVRDGREDGALPSVLRISDGERFLLLSRVRVDRARIDADALGTGLPPKHLPVRPLEALAEQSPRR